MIKIRNIATLNVRGINNDDDKLTLVKVQNRHTDTVRNPHSRRGMPV